MKYERLIYFIFVAGILYLHTGILGFHKVCFADEKIESSDKWENYRNDQYGFELQYPPGFEMDKFSPDNNLLSLRKEENGLICIDVLLQPKSLIKNISFKKNAKKMNAKKITIDGRQGYQYYFQEGAGYTGVVLIPLHDKTLQLEYTVIGSSGGINKISFVKKNINRIISTIKFI